MKDIFLHRSQVKLALCSCDSYYISLINTIQQWIDNNMITIQGGGGGIQSIQAGDNIQVDDSDPLNPEISVFGLGDVAYSNNYNDLDNLPAPIIQQFIQITEGGKTGWGLKYRLDNPAYYGDIGTEAVDLSVSTSNSTVKGAIGNWSTLSGGLNNSVQNTYSTVGGGEANTIVNPTPGAAQYPHGTISGGGSNSVRATAATVSGGLNNLASGGSSVIGGGEFNTVSSILGTVSGGIRNTSNSYGEWIGGLFSTIPSGQNCCSFVATDRLFNVGNGTATNARSNAFTILKNGLATLPSVTNTLIDSEPTGKAVITKEYLQQYLQTLSGYNAGATQTLKNISGVLTWVTD